VTLIYVVLAIAVAAAVWYFVLRKPAPELEAEKPAPRLKEGAPKEAAPAKAAVKEAQPAVKAEKPSTKPVEKPAAEKPAKPSPADDEDEDEVEVPIEVAPAPVGRSARPNEAARASEAPQSKRTKDVLGLRKGLAKARESEGFFGKLKALLGGRKEIDPRIADEIEEVLLTSDVGVKTTGMLVDAIKAELEKGELKDESKVWAALRAKATDILDIGGGGIALSAKPTVVMVVGVNGAGKTTTIGKLATRLVAQNKKVVLAAGDTFRAAAVQQLVVWGKRAGCEVVTGAESSNAGAVIFDAIQRAKEIGADVVLADTAGRLHTKTNLMDELKKIAKTMGKALDGAPHETLLVLDATNGQNATQQAALFKEALPLSGIVLTKLDGTAKGGVILGICAEHDVPVRYVGVGERPEDLRDFDADEFVEALLGSGSETADRAA
jgi:fused signal recognition particle receptor